MNPLTRQSLYAPEINRYTSDKISSEIGRGLNPQMRIRSKPWTYTELEQNSRLISKPAELKGKWNNHFGNQNPIHLELGCGKGKFITNTAMQNRDINYVAVERQSKVLAIALRRSTRMAEALRGISLTFLNGDVKDIEECFLPGEISRIYINFCDPWPNKNKWAKRRLTHSSFIALYERLFGANPGEIFFKTDNPGLFEFSVGEFTNAGWRLVNVTEDLHNSGFAGNVMTEYEEKYSARGLPIYRFEAYYTPGRVH